MVRQVGAEPLLGLNFGTGTVEMAVAYVEYCNLARGTRWSELRRKHGYDRPYNVRYWCLGNEMDGPWQIGQMTATRVRAEGARRGQADAGDRSGCRELIACGSSGHVHADLSRMGSRGPGAVLRLGRRLSLHRVLRKHAKETGNDSRRYLAMNLNMEKQITENAAVCDWCRG